MRLCSAHLPEEITLQACDSKSRNEAKRNLRARLGERAYFQPHAAWRVNRSGPRIPKMHREARKRPTVKRR
jgi:hypothetical protein